MKKALLLSEKDNTATVLEDVTIGDDVEIKDANKAAVCMIRALNDINRGHKIAIKNLQADDEIIKYNHTIGTATQGISAGQLVHIHNLASRRGRGDLR